MRRVLGVLVAATAAAALAGCSSAASSSSTPTGGSTASPVPTPASSAAALSGSIHVLAPATMTVSMPVLDKQFTTANPGVSIKPDIGHSPDQVTALHEGETADVLLTTGADSMTQAQQYGLLASSPVIFATNKLEIVVAKGNPKHITTLADLAKPGVTVLLSSEVMPIGSYADQALAKAHVTVHPASLEMGSPDIVEKVALGDADAGIVFVTDVASGGSKVQGVAIPAADQIVAPYEAAVLKSASDTAAAKAYVEFLVSSAAQATLSGEDFMAPSMEAMASQMGMAPSAVPSMGSSMTMAPSMTSSMMGS
jgi:molybdate transport system substrate-binding protein